MLAVSVAHVFLRFLSLLAADLIVLDHDSDERRMVILCDDEEFAIAYPADYPKSAKPLVRIFLAAVPGGPVAHHHLF